MKIGNVKPPWSAPWSLTVMGLDLAAMMNVVNNPREMWERTVQQTMSALVILYVALIMFAEIHVLEQENAVNYLVIVRRVREIVTRTKTVPMNWFAIRGIILMRKFPLVHSTAHDPGKCSVTNTFLEGYEKVPPSLLEYH